MSSKTDVQVLLGGKVYTLSGYESEEYLQKIALYINNKMSELNQLPGYKRMGSDMQKILLELNMADDYHKARKRINELETDMEDRDKTEYELKHELISVQIQLEESEKSVAQLKEEINELQKQIVKLEAKSY
jgi:cell division protein ZapA